MKKVLAFASVVVMGLFLVAATTTAVKKAAFIDSAKCVKCGTCFKGCPVKAIAKNEKDGKVVSYVVDPKKCIACGKCVKSCPVKAISWVDPAAENVKKGDAAKPSAAEKKPAEKKLD